MHQNLRPEKLPNILILEEHRPVQNVCGEQEKAGASCLLYVNTPVYGMMLQEEALPTAKKLGMDEFTASKWRIQEKLSMIINIFSHLRRGRGETEKSRELE